MSLLTEKQTLILESINKFGVITAVQLVEFLKGKVSHVTIYNSKEKLVDLGLISDEKIGYHSVIYMRPRGVDYLGSNLSKFTTISYGTLNHQLLSNDSILALIRLSNERNEAYDFLTEREIRSEFINSNIPLKDRRNTKLLKSIPDRIPDFIFTMAEDRVAYEVELNQKKAQRYQEKLKRYQDEILNGDFNSVFYLCETEKIAATVVKNAEVVGIPKEMLQISLLRRLLDIGK